MMINGAYEPNDTCPRCRFRHPLERACAEVQQITYNAAMARIAAEEQLKPDWKVWFDRWGEYVVKTQYYSCNSDWSVEQMYQMFKARLQAEL